MPKEPSQTGGSLPSAPDKFKAGDKVKRGDEIGAVITRVPYREGDSHAETYTVKGMAGTIPAEALTKAE